MPIERYHSVDEMPALSRVDDPEERLRRMSDVWDAAQLLSDGDPPRGVLRFRSVEAANRARRERLVERMRRRRENPGLKSGDISDG